MKKPVATTNAPEAIGPYSQAIISGNTIYVSGQLPINPATGEIPKSASEQARQSLSNLRAVLEAAGSSLEKTLRVGIFLTDLNDFNEVNEIYSTFFNGAYPARTTVQVVAVPKGAKLEIEAIAEL